MSNQIRSKKARNKEIRKKNPITGMCVECGKPCRLGDNYIVTTACWKTAGMPTWDSGYLHFHCLEKRLGRTVRNDELLVWTEGSIRQGFQWRFTQAYLTSPEFLQHF